jgi:SpoVK/Ycf46/Vps4 family AAA+-type ATPase
MNAVEDVRAVLLLRVGTGKADILRALAAMEGVYSVERIQGPYDIVVQVAGREDVEAIEKLAGITAAEICWVSAPHEIASDARGTPGEVGASGASHLLGGHDPPGPVGTGFTNRLRGLDDQ